MYKENRGFTLLELIISIAVLSIMAGVLFQAFVVSRRIDTKAAKEERVQNLAKGVMEDMKGVVFGELGVMDGTEEEEPSELEINGITYTYKTFSSSEGADGYLLEAEYQLPSNSDEKADYLIKVEADFGHYKKEAEEGNSDSAYTVNNYEMPNIADISSFQNVVISPDMLLRDDVLQIGELLLKVNEEAETETLDGLDETAEEQADTKDPYTEEMIRRVLQIDIKEIKNEGNGESAGDSDTEKLILNVKGIYSVADITDGGEPAYDPDLSIDFPIDTFKKQIEIDEKTKAPLNRIYLFLPEQSANIFKKIYITAEAKLKEKYELFVIVPKVNKAANAEGSIGEDDIIIKHDNVKDNILLFSNLENNKPVSYYPAEERVYRLKVTIYEAEYENEGSDPVQGKKLLNLDSTKSE